MEVNVTESKKFASVQFVCKCGVNLIFAWNLPQFCNKDKFINAIQNYFRFAHHAKVKCFTAIANAGKHCTNPLFALWIEDIKHDAKLQISV